MKKKLALVLVLALAVFAFAACGGDTTPPVEDPETPETPVAGEAVKTGYAVISKAAKSADAGDADGLAQADSTIVAVTVDENGVLTNVAIDHAQTKINFSKDGKIVTPLDTVFPESRKWVRHTAWLKHLPSAKSGMSRQTPWHSM